MRFPAQLLSLFPKRARLRLEPVFDALSIVGQIRDPRVLAALGPSAVRGMVFRRGKQATPTRIPATHEAYFDWSYPADQPEMRDLYRRAKQQQWDAERDIDWSIDVDPLNPVRPIVPEDFFDFDALAAAGVRLNAKERGRFGHSMASWTLSQFLHGEQGALFAAAQVTEAVQFFDGKLYGATQVLDEARHVEVFHRYLDTKLERLYFINDNLFTIIDSLMSDSRWDMKFLGMQIMVEGLALGAFGALYTMTAEPLLKTILGRVIQDEARHVHYGVLALREHILTELSESERQEREDWCFEVALLMKNRLMAHEVYEEWFEGRLTRAQWNQIQNTSYGMEQFRSVMFRRLVPNLREIGLLSDRIIPRYDRAGLMKYFHGPSATELAGGDPLSDFTADPTPSPGDGAPLDR